MNRNEALNILGLEDDASADDIKVAYRETVPVSYTHLTLPTICSV